MASARAIDTTSLSAEIATASAVGMSMLQVCGSKLGADSGGKLDGSAPTVVTEPGLQRLRTAATKPPVTIARIMKGTRGRKRRAAMPLSSVANATTVVGQDSAGRWATVFTIESRNSALRGIGTPKKFRACETMMRVPTPAVYPTTTECEMKLTIMPSLNSPRDNSSTPTIAAKVSASSTYRADPGSANAESEANKISEAVVLGPATRCQEEPNSAAMIVGTIPAYRPYCGGMPAIVAKATPCGSTTMAPVRPARKSANRVSRFVFGSQTRNGNIPTSRDRLLGEMRE